ncbi:hypothetical protein [Streptomyces sp. NPDC048623]|uniref:hypothetical protein n=1 Tax=Streptomyces sp. NPDC048623 TaxID=3155761 RepID=UPI0034342758
MATPINFFRGAAPTALTTAYTVPEAGQAIVTNIVAANPSTTTVGSVAVKLGGIDIVPAVSLAAKGVLTLEINQVLDENEAIQVQGSGAACTLHVSGVEV